MTVKGDTKHKCYLGKMTILHTFQMTLYRAFSNPRERGKLLGKQLVLLHIKMNDMQIRQTGK